MKRNALRRRIASPLCALASCLSLLAVEHAAAQAPDWQSEIARADSAYDEAMEKAGERRRIALQKAGDTWVRAIDTEIAEAAKAGDMPLARSLQAKLARSLQAKLAEARDAGRVPLARPPIVAFGRHQYALIDEPKTWMEAKKHCDRLGGHLLILDSAEEEAFILANLAKLAFWVGATDLWTPGRTMSLDGKPFRGFAAKVAFDNFRNRENVVAWAVRAKCWNDLSDGVRIAYVCEWE